MAIVGIDLGTTNSLVSYWDGENSVIIPNVFGDNYTPSVVGIGDEEEILIGKVAKERLITHPHLTASSFKRFMGTGKTYNMGKYVFTPTDLSSLLLKSLITDAEEFLNEKVTEAIISVPAYFSDLQRKQTRLAGELIGLNVKRIINEPTAAAIAYGILNNNTDTKFLVLDIGGGTFDCSLLEIFDELIEIKAVSGDNYLGGEDFTSLIASYFKSNFKLSNIDNETEAKLYKQCEKCKIELNTKKSSICKININDEIFEGEISSETFEMLSKDLMKRISLTIERVIRDSKIKPDEIDNVVLVGGTSRLALFKKVVTLTIGVFPNCNVNPDEAIAIGCGIMSGIINKSTRFKETMLLDICPYTLGVNISHRAPNGSIISGLFSPIIERNTTLPASKSQVYSTLNKNQREIEFEIYQGESIKVCDNIHIGNILVKVPKNTVGKEAVEVRFTYNVEGILEVETKVLSTGIITRLVIQNNETNFSDEYIKTRLKELKNIKIHPRNKQENSLLMARANRMYSEFLGDDRDLISEVIFDFEAALETQRDELIIDSRDKLMSVLDYFEMTYFNFANILNDDSYDYND